MRTEKSSLARQVAGERMRILFSLAKKALKEKKPARAKRYVFLARSLGTRYLVRLPKLLKRSYCKKCGVPWIPGENLRVRLKPKKFVEYLCLSCGFAQRFPHKITRARRV